MSRRKSKIVNTWVTVQVESLLSAYAEKHDLSRGDVVRQAIREFMTARPADFMPAELPHPDDAQPVKIVYQEKGE